MGSVVRLSIVAFCGLVDFSMLCSLGLGFQYEVLASRVEVPNRSSRSPPGFGKVVCNGKPCEDFAVQCRTRRVQSRSER